MGNGTLLGTLVSLANRNKGTELGVKHVELAWQMTVSRSVVLLLYLHWFLDLYYSSPKWLNYICETARIGTGKLLTPLPIARIGFSVEKFTAVFVEENLGIFHISIVLLLVCSKLRK